MIVLSFFITMCLSKQMLERVMIDLMCIDCGAPVLNVKAINLCLLKPLMKCEWLHTLGMVILWGIHQTSTKP